MEVTAITLTQGVDLTLVSEGKGWRFSNWSRCGESIFSRPSDEDSLRLFESPASAVAFFRNRYEMQLQSTLRL